MLLQDPWRAEPDLLGMLQLNAAFSSIVVDVLEGDPQGAKASFRNFRARYREAAAMVPEWTAYYPPEPVEALGRALENPDRERVMARQRVLARLGAKA